jgi:hypothetical protein
VTSHKDSFVRREIGYAQGCRKPITPLLFPGCPDGQLPILISHLTWIDFADFDKGLCRLLDRLSRGGDYIPPPVLLDPFHEYLQALYKETVAYLDKTVFALLSLHAEAATDTADVSEDAPLRALPMSFLTTSLPVKGPSHNAPQRARQFESFAAAYEHLGSRAVMLGGAGSGKTTTLLAHARDAVARRLENPQEPLPLVARLSDWSGADELAIAAWLADILHLDPDAVSREVERGRTLLLLDGLDELVGADQRGDVRLRLIDAINGLPKTNRVVVTCRLQDYEELSRKVHLNGAVTLSSLSDTQIAAYLEKHPDLWAALQRDEVLRDMARTPLLLCLLTFAYAELGSQACELRELNNSPRELRDKIFSTYVQRRYEHEKLKRHRELAFSLEEIRDVLGYAAHQRLWKNVLGRVPQTVESSTPHADEGIDESVESRLGDRTAGFLDLARCLNYAISDNRGQTRFIHVLLEEHFGLAYARAASERILPASSLTDEEKLNVLRSHRATAAVLSDPSLTVEDKVALMIMLIVKKIDQEIELQAQQVTWPPRGIDVEQMKLKRLIDKRSQMFDMLRELIDRYNQTAKNIIDTTGR